MLRRATTSALVVLLAAVAALAQASPARAVSSLSLQTCPSTPGFECATLPVPLDRTGQLPGSVPLSIERKAAGSSPTREAVLALAGGPGQSALPLGEFIASTIAPALGSRDLLVFDQRGTGSSDPLSCSALEEPTPAPSPGRLLEQCALDIGPARGNFTTQESIQDIEALRVAGGYAKLVLYGTSYGTKVALAYAARYPARVAALVLDSVVPADGPEPLGLPTFQAIAPVLAELCSNRDCAGITASPLADVARLASQLHRRPLRGSVYDGSGRRHSSTMREDDLLGILQAGDLNPALRALLPAAVRAALRGDADPLLRLSLLSQGLIPNLPGASAAARHAAAIDEALFATTTCEETPFPWQRGAAPATRAGEALAALRAQPAGAFYPFDAMTAWNTGLIPNCVDWPFASPPPPAATALPNVPTLILSGAQDLRTPTANARRVASAIPAAQLLVAPFTGHSVLGSDLSGCAAHAIAAFFANSPVQPCTDLLDRFAPTPLAPRRLAYIQAPATLPGRAGETLVAVLDTLIDLNRQVIGATLQASQELPDGSSFGGLRGGYARLSSTSVTLRRFAFVPGVELSGTFPVRNGELQPATIHVSGGEAAGGTIRIGSAFRRASGTLGGHRVSVSVSSVHLSALATDGWPGPAAIVSLARRLAASSRPRTRPLSQLP